MGFSPLWSRPDWMICQVLPIAPPSVRPSVKHDAQQRSEDDLTHIYSNIVKTNNFVKYKMTNPDSSQFSIEMPMETLQHSIAMIANNKIKGVSPMAQRSGRPLQCITGRINSKNGRIRGNLMGKRVDYSARSVITGDPNLSIQQLGVPLKIAKNITKPVIVNDRNKLFLLKLAQNGPDLYPGAKILEKKSGLNISLRYVDRTTLSLENGDIVHRHMLDGDMCLFNRQPSLHRPSMMGHIAKIMNIGDTFRMNVGDTKPYNADFDGDEMNLHFAQNIVAETELRHLTAVPYQIISAENNTPIIGIFQDSLLGSYRFTRENINISTRDAMNLLMSYNHVNVDKLRNTTNTLTSFEIISQIMPKITMKYKTSLFDDDVDDKNTSNDTAPITLHTDASDYGVGGYLFQTVDGIDQPVAFVSKSLNKSQLRWSVIQKEAYGIFYSCIYLQSLLRDRFFAIRTDHRNLLFITEASNPMIVRWYMALPEFSFTLEFIPGVDNDKFL